MNVLDLLLPEPGAFYVMDRAYLDFARLSRFPALGRRVLRYPCEIEHQIPPPVFPRRGQARGRPVRPDRRPDGHDVEGRLPAAAAPDQIPRRRNRQTFNFLTNNFVVPAATVADLYRCRWQVELFFKWIKQHLRIKSFFGTSENAVKTQILDRRGRLRARGDHQEATWASTPASTLFSKR